MTRMTQAEKLAAVESVSMIPAGNYQATVHFQGTPAEQFSMSVDGRGLVRVNGPQWYGFGVLQDDRYFGFVWLKQHVGYAVHFFQYDYRCEAEHVLAGSALCLSPLGQINQTDGLTWVIPKVARRTA